MCHVLLSFFALLVPVCNILFALNPYFTKNMRKTMSCSLRGVQSIYINHFSVSL